MKRRGKSAGTQSLNSLFSDILHNPQYSNKTQTWHQNILTYTIVSIGHRGREYGCSQSRNSSSTSILLNSTTTKLIVTRSQLLLW